VFHRLGRRVFVEVCEILKLTRGQRAVRQQPDACKCVARGAAEHNWIEGLDRAIRVGNVTFVGVQLWPFAVQGSNVAQTEPVCEKTGAT
jgi:hypothetical protein